MLDGRKLLYTFLKGEKPQNSFLFMSIFNFSANNFYKECVLEFFYERATEQAIFSISGTGLSSGIIVLSSIPASSAALESGGRQMKQC
jgi:hypothetical protein